jgi:site-specific recombinase XerD
VFLSRRSEPLTRFGIHEIVTRYARAAMNRMPDMRKKRIGPHTIRHYAGLRTIPGAADRNARKARQC